MPPGRKKTPLSVAIDLGFHSLVELLARDETSQEVKNKGLSDAGAAKRLDLAQLLLEHGAEIKSIPLMHAFGTWDPAIIRLRDTSMKKNAGNLVKPIRVQAATVKKSVATMTSRCRHRNSFQVVFRLRSGAGSRPYS